MHLGTNEVNAKKALASNAALKQTVSIFVPA